MRALAVASLLLASTALAGFGLGGAAAADSPPDLWVDDAWANGTLEEGSTLSFQAIVANSGAPTTADVVVRFTLDDAWTSDAALPAGFSGYAQVTAPDTWTATAGSHTLKVEVDATGAQAESDETNNVFTTVLQVTTPTPPPPPPPPPPTRETMYAWGTSGNSTLAGDRTTLTLSTDHWGVWYDMSCNSSTVQVYLDGQLVATCAQGVRTQMGSTYLTAGAHTLRVAYAGTDSAWVEISGIATS